MSNDRLADILRLCEETLGLDSQARASYLDSACGGDAALRRDVESLLSEQLGSSGFLDTPPWAPAGSGFAVGQRLGPYEVTGTLGTGGMGAVYKARDTRLERTVALKVIAGAGALAPAAQERFTREARAVAALRHPHICALYDVGREGDTDFLVMEFLEGETLEHRLHGAAGEAAGSPLAVGEAVRLATQIADGLAAAHRQGIIHRDLKPANVMLTKADDGLQATLLDFGLAKLAPRASVAGEVPDAPPANPPASSAGSLVGTMPYIAPEQLEGKPVDARTDLFAFGCVLYEMLTGRRAFDGASSAAVIAAILEREPPPIRRCAAPGAGCAGKPGKEVPGEVARRALRVRPRHRRRAAQAGRDGRRPGGSGSACGPADGGEAAGRGPLQAGTETAAARRRSRGSRRHRHRSACLASVAAGGARFAEVRQTDRRGHLRRQPIGNGRPRPRARHSPDDEPGQAGRPGGDQHAADVQHPEPARQG